MSKQKSDKTRATEAQAEKIVLAIRGMRAEGRTKSCVKRFVADKFGIAWQQAEIYISRARDESIQEAKIDLLEQEAQIVDFLKSQMHGADCTPRDKILAARALIGLLGLEKHHITHEVRDEGTVDLTQLGLPDEIIVMVAKAIRDKAKAAAAQSAKEL